MQPRSGDLVPRGFAQDMRRKDPPLRRGPPIDHTQAEGTIGFPPGVGDTHGCGGLEGPNSLTKWGFLPQKDWTAIETAT